MSNLFICLLPLTLEAVPHMLHEQEKTAPMISSESPVRRRRILVIDDAVDTEAMLRDLLNTMGFDVVAVSSGQHSLALLGEQASNGCRIDGILLNWNIPGLDAMAVLQQLQDQHAETPVIVMTSLRNIDRIDWSEDV